MHMPANIYKQITRLAESEIKANMKSAERAGEPVARYGFQRQAIGIFQYWQMLTRGFVDTDRRKDDETRLSSYLVGPSIPGPLLLDEAHTFLKGD